MSSFGEILGSFKAYEEPDNIVAILEDKELQNGLIAWKSVGIRYKPASDCSERDPVSQWNWLWEQVDYDAQSFGVVAGLKAQDVGKVITRLIGLRLIYPDGTVHRLAKSYLQSIIMRKIGPAKRASAADNTPSQRGRAASSNSSEEEKT